jgi:hypothetical protein
VDDLDGPPVRGRETTHHRHRLEQSVPGEAEAVPGNSSSTRDVGLVVLDEESHRHARVEEQEVAHD